MGGGIAQLFAEKGISVRIKDINAKGGGGRVQGGWDIFRKRIEEGILDPLQARDGMDRITGATDCSGFSAADLAVEAVVENMEVKKSVLRDFEQVAKDTAIFASNTSSLSITELATASKRPDRSWACTSSIPWKKCRSWKSCGDNERRRRPSPPLQRFPGGLASSRWS